MLRIDVNKMKNNRDIHTTMYRGITIKTNKLCFQTIKTPYKICLNNHDSAYGLASLLLTTHLLLPSNSPVRISTSHTFPILAYGPATPLTLPTYSPSTFSLPPPPPSHHSVLDFMRVNKNSFCSSTACDR